MFSSALKSFTSNITSNYSLSQKVTSTSGPWKIYDGKKKSTGKAVSVFVFERKALEPRNSGLIAGGLSRAAGASVKRVQEEVVERLKKEASSLARLRHPSILELAEPVEETRNGGLMFATEPVTSSLGGLLLEKDEQEKMGGVGGRPSRYVIEETDGGGRRRREVEIDELEIQKGLLQIAKGLEFLHESAGLVHGNLTPEAIYINAKSDWKISGLGFSSPPNDSGKATPVGTVAPADLLNQDHALPRFVQLNLDFASPDLVLDTNIATSADLFSLGLLIISLYNFPHSSPIKAKGNQNNYKRLFNSSSTIPSHSNNFLCSRPLPRELLSAVLPRLITRQPAPRLTAREFQQAQYFDNILVSTIRFLDSLPAKTPNEKGQFMRGLPRVLSQFPSSVLEKKVLPALLEEMKDRDLLPLVLQNVFKIIKMAPSGKRAFTERVIPRLQENFLNGHNAASAGKTAAPDRDLGKEAGLMVILENISVATEKCSGKEFKDNILPILNLGLESSTHGLVDKSLRCLPTILPILDFSTLKNDLFPVIAAVFSKTNSLGIKVRALEAFVALCGGSSDSTHSEMEVPSGFMGSHQSNSKKQSLNASLDKYTIQEKLVPLLKAIKTKEPAVMMAALAVFRRIGNVADPEFIAVEILPILWSFSLGPLLNLEQFRDYLNLTKSLSTRIEQEHSRKLQELSVTSANESKMSPGDDIMSFGSEINLNTSSGSADGADVEFERLVLGKPSGTQGIGPAAGGWEKYTGALNDQMKSQTSHLDAPVFSWSTQPPTASRQQVNDLERLQQAGTSRTITPDLTNFAMLTPSIANASTFSTPLQSPPSATTTMNRSHHQENSWGNPIPATNTSISSIKNLNKSMSNVSNQLAHNLTYQGSNSALTAPPSASSINVIQKFQDQTTHQAIDTPFGEWAIAPPPAIGVPAESTHGQALGTPLITATNPSRTQKKGLDAYTSLL